MNDTDGIAEAGPRRLVKLFSARVRAAADLGPSVRRCGRGLAADIDLLAARWSSVMRTGAELRYDVRAWGVMLQGDVNSDGHADFHVRVLAVSSLIEADFLL